MHIPVELKLDDPQHIAMAVDEKSILPVIHVKRCDGMPTAVGVLDTFDDTVRLCRQRVAILAPHIDNSETITGKHADTPLVEAQTVDTRPVNFETIPELALAAVS